MSDLSSDPGFNPQNYSATQFQLNNQGFNSASALQIRMNPERIIQDFEIYLKGKNVVQVQNPKTKQLEFVDLMGGKGKAVVNDLGYQAVMGWLTMIMNNQVIQGNFLDESYFGEYLMNLRKDVAMDLIVNRRNYELDIREVEPLIAKFMNCSYLLLTRPLFNKERDGMNNTVKVVENSQTMPLKTGMMSNIPFFGGGRK